MRIRKTQETQEKSKISLVLERSRIALSWPSKGKCFARGSPGANYTWAILLEVVHGISLSETLMIHNLGDVKPRWIS